MTLLEESRAEIDRVDREMADLFCRRMEAVAGVVRYKQQTGMPVLDTGREAAVIQKNGALVPEDLRPYYEQLLKTEMALSRQYQNRVLGRNTVAYQGVAGAWSHLALRRLFPAADALALSSWAEVFDAVESGRAVHGVLPFENSSAGDVSAVLDLCYAHPDLYVSARYDLPIQQDLLCLPGATLADIKTVVSHPQALSQCGRFLMQHGFATREWTNTALAAQWVSQQGDPSLAAIAGAENAGLYGLEVLCPHINTATDNTTRFVVIGKQRPARGDRFSLLFTVDHRPGRLAQAIGTIGQAGYNMECIKSRPRPGVQFEYYFYAEIVGGPADPACQELLDRLSEICTTVRLLGAFEREETRAEE